MNNSKSGIYKRFFKRPMDFILSLIAIIVLSPLILIVAVLVKTKLGSPVLFRQERPGLNEKIFLMYKFRSMTNERDSKGNLLPDDIRLTKFGKLLRSTSLDELPGIFNILKGDMSIVGPRPLAVQYLPYYNADEKRRHSVRPGLTGLAQINGRNTVKWEEKFDFDIKYINNIKLFEDFRIILKTFIKVFKQDDIGVRGSGNQVDFDKYREGNSN